ncbi:MAG TPA: hypothetical protein VK137_01305, partial [Planctomycetaceae bacterium]|nr:hypothetical protein [Planctomycetaceae bacterium]
MKSFRLWIQVGLWSAIALGSSSSRALPDDASELLRPPAVTPDVTAADILSSDESTKAEATSLRPEPESALPTTSATPPTGNLTDAPKPQTPMDIDDQFEIPIELDPVPATNNAGNGRRLFSDSPTLPPQSRLTLPRLETPPPQTPVRPAPVVATEPADPLLQLVNEAIDVSGRRFLTPDGALPHTPWQIIHGLLAYRQEYQLKMSDGRKVNGLEWLSSGVTYHG